jgi:hypothetical protein
VTGSVGFVGSSCAAGRPLYSVEMLGAGLVGEVPPPEPITVPGAKATPRKASSAPAVAMTEGEPESVPPIPEASVIS